MFFWNALAFSLIKQMLGIWSLAPLLFLNITWTSGSSWFTYCWSLACRILSITLLACEMSAIVQWFVHSLTPPFRTQHNRTYFFFTSNPIMLFWLAGCFSGLGTQAFSNLLLSDLFLCVFQVFPNNLLYAERKKGRGSHMGRILFEAGERFWWSQSEVVHILHTSSSIFHWLELSQILQERLGNVSFCAQEEGMV